MKIIVITPVKNEAWILERFLSVTSIFADHIIIADQNSTDGSLDIYARYPKVVLVKNESNTFNEAERQILLFKKAREIEPGPKVILALDADEILAANAMETPGWQTMLNAEPGTMLCFEKPEMYLNTENTIRYSNTWPLGFIDDGITEHKPSLIHSIRVPISKSGSILHLNEIKILHYAMTRMNAQQAKWRMYSVIESSMSTMSLRQRRKMYVKNKDWTENRIIEKTPSNWFHNWEKQGIDMQNINDSKYYWQDLYTLQLFSKHGVNQFWNEDIWDANWEGALAFFKQAGKPDLPEKIIRPSGLRLFLLKTFDKLMAIAYRLFR